MPELETVLRDAAIRSELRRGDIEALEQRVLDEYTSLPKEAGMTLEEFIQWPLGETFYDEEGRAFTFV